MKHAIIASLFLAGCAHKPVPPPRIVTIEVKVPVPVPCVDAAQIPGEPPLIADQLTGNAAADIGIVAMSALGLRQALREARALLLGCVR